MRLVEGSVSIIVGDCTETLRDIPSGSVNTCVTSPPYFGLRDYGVGGQIGIEQTPDEFVARLVGVFREVHRVLRDDGTLWLNLGDSYANPGHAKGNPGSGRASFAKVERERGFNHSKAWPVRGTKTSSESLGAWRSPCKPMAGICDRTSSGTSRIRCPESVRDRCTKAHEYIFMLSKGPKYYFDQKAIMEPASAAGLHRVGTAEVRNKRSVWTVATKPFKGAHFATFPPDLIEPCILAGSAPGGVVLDPFAGSGTTGIVAARHGREAILCELNREYAEIAADRIRNDLYLPKFHSSAPDGKYQKRVKDLETFI